MPVQRTPIYVGPPAARTIKWSEPGDHVTGAIYNIRRIQALDFKTKKPMTWDDGSPVMQHEVSMFVTDYSEGLMLSAKPPAEPVLLADESGIGTPVRVYVKSSDKRLFLEAQPADGFCLGDELSVKFTHTAPSEKGGADRKHRTYSVTVGDDQIMYDRCEAAATALKAEHENAQSDENAEADGGWDDDDDWDDDVDDDLPDSFAALKVWCEENGIRSKTVMQHMVKQGYPRSSKLTAEQARATAAAVAAEAS